MSRLYAVRLICDIVVFADDPDEAAKKASDHHPEERRHDRVEHVRMVVQPEDLPHKWDTGCIPYGRKDDLSIGQILGVPPGPRFSISKGLCTSPGDCRVASACLHDCDPDA